MQKYHILHDNILACCLSQWAWLIMGVIAWEILSTNLSHALDKDHEHWGLPKTDTHTTLTEPIIVAQSGSLLFEAIKSGHEMPGAINTYTEPTWHNMRLRAFEGYKNTHTQLWPNWPLWRRVDRVCSVKCIKFGLEMPGAVNAHTEPTWHNMRLRSFEGYQKHTPTQLWPSRPLWRRVDRVCLRPFSLATRCLAQ